MATLFDLLDLDDLVQARHVEFELGVKVPIGYEGSPKWQSFLLECELRDFLDMITIMHVAVSKHFPKDDAFVRKMTEIFNEENVNYRIETDGSVHYRVDAEFHRNQVSAITALEEPKFAGALSHFQAAQRAFDGDPQDTREAMRQTFECVETVFKLLYPGTTILGSAEAIRKLRPAIEAHFDGPERSTNLQLLEAFKKWVDSMQTYRHGHGLPNPEKPSISTAVLSSSIGASYIRWLIDLDSR